MTDSTFPCPHLEKINYDPFALTFFAQFGTLDFGVFVRPDSPSDLQRVLITQRQTGKLTMGSPK